MAKKDSTPTGSFPTQGDSASRLSNVAKPIKGRSVPKTGNAKGGSAYPEATKANRSGVLERHGASYAPQTTLYKANAAEASFTQRNTVIVPAAMGNRDFWLKRQYGQAAQ